MGEQAVPKPQGCKKCADLIAPKVYGTIREQEDDWEMCDRCDQKKQCDQFSSQLPEGMRCICYGFIAWLNLKGAASMGRYLHHCIEAGTMTPPNEYGGG